MCLEACKEAAPATMSTAIPVHVTVATPPREIGWWDGFGALAFVAVLSFVLTVGVAWWSRRRERLGEIVAMQAELYQGFKCMTALRNQPNDIGQQMVLAPLYRLPLRMFDRALPKLIGDAKLTDNEINDLLEYAMRADELNRGLERAGDAHAARNDLGMVDEYTRNIAKVAHILDVKPERPSGESLYDAAWAALIRVGGDKRRTSRLT